MSLINIEEVKRRIVGKKPRPLEKMAKFAVIIPIINIDDELHIIFESRAKDLRTQPGEISFPGGKLEKGESFKEAAVRETMEELNIARKNINVLAEMDYLISYSNMEIHSFLATIDGLEIDEIFPNPGEVDHIFIVPLKFFLENDPNGYYLEVETKYNKEFPYNLIPNGEDYEFRKARRTIYFYEYNNYIIWGFTAAILKNCIGKIKTQ